MNRKEIEGIAKLSLEKARGEVEVFETAGNGGYSEIAIEKIHPDPDQPRKEFSLESLRSLAETIRKVGVLQPLTVDYNPESTGYRIIIGERRYRGAKIAGLEKIPCIVREVDEEQRLLHQLIENLQKEDLNPFERAEGIHLLMRKFNYTQADVATALGRKESTISEDLSVLKLPDDVREELRRAEGVSKRTVVQVAAEKDPHKQRDLAQKVLKDGITSEDIRRAKEKNPLNPFIYESLDGRFTVTARFRKTKVTRDVLMDALRKAYLSVKHSKEGMLFPEGREEGHEREFNQSG